MFVCPVRARRLLAKRSARGAYFNPRARLGHDLWVLQCGVPRYFNPRARLGHDYGIEFNYISMEISIHVPAWGTTLMPVEPSSISISIHVPAWGMT